MDDAAMWFGELHAVVMENSWGMGSVFRTISSSSMAGSPLQ